MEDGISQESLVISQDISDAQCRRPFNLGWNHSPEAETEKPTSRDFLLVFGDNAVTGA